MKKILFILCCIFLTSNSLAQESGAKNNAQPFVIGETITMTSEILKEDRTLNIYLPQGYAESDKTYHVIYLLDGSADEDFVHIAGLVQFGSFSWINMIPETIVVGISNIDRKRDFTFPTTNQKDKKEFPTTGGSEKFIQFLELELQPFIASNYKISEDNTIIGQSLGGLLAAEVAIKKPALFDNYIIVSPSMWWDDESLFELPQAAITSPKSIFVGVGTEGPTMQTGATKLYYKFWLNFENTENRVFYKFLEAQDHGDALHLAAYDALEKIFRKSKE